MASKEHQAHNHDLIITNPRDQKKTNVYKVKKEDDGQNPDSKEEEREADINPHLNERVNLQYMKFIETQLQGKERDAIKNHLVNGIPMEKKPVQKLSPEEEKSYDWHRNVNWKMPDFKFGRQFYFGGMKKSLKVPISNPFRVIVEPNPPRQGFSHLTWLGLNQYYLQKVLQKEEYEEILLQCKNTAFRVYSINREENRFLSGTWFAAFSNVVWAICALSIASLVYYEGFEKKYTAWGQTATIITFSVSIFLVFIMSIINFLQSPPTNIFLNYEKFLRMQLNSYFEEINAKYKSINGIEFKVSQNDVVWIEIYVPKQHQMPFSEFQIKQHIEILDEKAVKEVDGTSEEPELTTLYMIVASKDEADEHNDKLKVEKELADSVNIAKAQIEQQEREEKEYKVLDKNTINKKKTKKIEKKAESSTSEDDLDVDEQRLSKRRRNQRENSDANRKPHSVKDKKLKDFLQIPTQQKREQSNRQGYQNQQDEFSIENSSQSMIKKAASPRRNKELSREREGRDRGEEDTAKKVMPQKDSTSSKGNAIRGERIKQRGNAPPKDYLGAQDVSGTNSHQDRGSSQTNNDAISDKKKSRNQFVKNNAGDDEMFSGRESIDNHPTRTPISPRPQGYTQSESMESDNHNIRKQRIKSPRSDRDAKQKGSAKKRENNVGKRREQ